METNQRNPAKSRTGFNLDSRLLIVFLLVVIAAMLFVWRPWDATGATDRTIDVTGHAKLTAEPDEFTFYPNYQFQNANKDTALAEATQKSNDIVATLRTLGVDESNIKVDTSGFTSGYPLARDQDTPVYSLQITVIVRSKDQAQKIQNYLTTTAPSGQVSPQGTFSDSKRKELEDKAREEATRDARDRAERSAQNLGFKIGKVKAVSDGAGFNGPIPERRDVMTTDMRAPSDASLPVQPGENELNYSVAVTYYLR